MMKTLLPLLVAGCGHTAAYAAPSQQLPKLVTDLVGSVDVEVRINDLPLTRHEAALHVPVPDYEIDVPAYYFKPGKNTIAIKYVNQRKDDPNAKVKIQIGNARFDIKTFAGCDSDFDVRCTATATFDMPGTTAKAPTTIQDTPANREALRGAYVAFHARLSKLVPREDGLPKRNATQAERAKLKHQLRGIAGDVDDLVALTGSKLANLDDIRWEDEQLEFQLIGDATHARMWIYRIPLIWFAGGTHDAPRGTMGPFSIGFDIWFKLDGGKFVPVAVWRTKPMLTLP